MYKSSVDSTEGIEKTDLLKFAKEYQLEVCKVSPTGSEDTAIVLSGNNLQIRANSSPQTHIPLRDLFIESCLFEIQDVKEYERARGIANSYGLDLSISDSEGAWSNWASENDVRPKWSPSVVSFLTFLREVNPDRVGIQVLHRAIKSEMSVVELQSWADIIENTVEDLSEFLKKPHGEEPLEDFA